MAWLKRARYHVLSLEEFIRFRREHRLPPARSVVITFDDGYADNRTIAYPILRQHGFPATIFLVTGAVGSSNQWDSDGELAGRSLLSWADIQEMRHGGIDFGAHTRTHVLLTSLPPSQMEDEVKGSRVDLELNLGFPVLAFAYPYGKYDVSSLETAERAGFFGACSCRSGVNDPGTPTYFLRRTEIRGTDSLICFGLMLGLGGSELRLRRRNQGTRMRELHRLFAFMRPKVRHTALGEQVARRRS
jgi:peptidoglycan/xylan/chitin deacetylase (PgdA/CDA1 family)